MKFYKVLFTEEQVKFLDCLVTKEKHQSTWMDNNELTCDTILGALDSAEVIEVPQEDNVTTWPQNLSNSKGKE